VDRSAAYINGTTAGLRFEEFYSIYDLQFALMLPSGNDAAIVLGECFGMFLTFEDLDATHLRRRLPHVVSIPFVRSEEYLHRF
jgi:hypothetical protein